MFFSYAFKLKKKDRKKTHSFSKMKFLKTSFKLGIVQKFKEHGFERYFHWDNTVVSCILGPVSLTLWMIDVVRKMGRCAYCSACSDHTPKSCLQIEHKSVFFSFLLFKNYIFLLDEAAGLGFEQFYKWFK